MVAAVAHGSAGTLRGRSTKQRAGVLSSLRAEDNIAPSDDDAKVHNSRLLMGTTTPSTRGGLRRLPSLVPRSFLLFGIAYCTYRGATSRGGGGDGMQLRRSAFADGAVRVVFSDARKKDRGCHPPRCVWLRAPAAWEQDGGLDEGDLFLESLYWQPEPLLDVPRMPVEPMIGSEEARKLEKSKDYVDDYTDMPDDKCEPQYEWQARGYYPTCNALHEVDLRTPFVPQTDGHRLRYRMLSYGSYRDVWSLVDEGDPSEGGSRRKPEKVVLKTLRYSNKFTLRNYHKHRKDALIMERLTKSRFIVNVFGYCGSSGFFEYADGGDITDTIWPKGHDKHRKIEIVRNMTGAERLRIAAQASMGLADLHNVDREGRASIAHTDISPRQFIRVNGTFKLNDFNRARAILWRRDRDEPCPFDYYYNAGTNRSPEEYTYENNTEKIDVYSLGNIFYMLLQGQYPFYQYDDREDVVKRVVKGERPKLDDNIASSSDPIDQTLIKAMKMCHVADPSVRASARQVETLLTEKLRAIDPDSLKAYGM